MCISNHSPRLTLPPLALGRPPYVLLGCMSSSIARAHVHRIRRPVTSAIPSQQFPHTSSGNSTPALP
ncbi:hypothetical protein P691DRAFT_813577 [Macrolepiota fuliginosa MF-IS2]|uniref:Uncharacterized protein n=1 Tax=Macrolepiota fuliginosa MF-IS2 TaxID=1400762 RepID=A0A9P5WXW8_9AGAR|nr:hypothetical protein P691DRAFT_813577 [Macrolepiota fuliginosa MF-IS2]